MLRELAKVLPLNKPKVTEILPYRQEKQIYDSLHTGTGTSLGS
jgi:hypothetical protein